MLTILIVIIILLIISEWNVRYSTEAYKFKHRDKSVYPSPDTAVDIARIDACYKISKEMKERYYRSDKWKLLKFKRMSIKGSNCELCNSTDNIELHHLTYERLTNEHLSDVILLCRNCHQKQHDYYGYDRTTLYTPLIA